LGVESQWNAKPVDGVPVDLHPTQHLVSDLDQVARIEEGVATDSSIGDRGRVRVQRTAGPQGASLGDFWPCDNAGRCLRRANRGTEPGEAYLRLRQTILQGQLLPNEIGIDLLGPGGVLTTVGGHRPDTRMSIDPADLVWKQLDIRESALGANNYENCIAVLAKGEYPFEKLVTHRFNLTEIQTALETFGRRGDCIKPVIVFD
jgi:hypothetical protein